MTDGDRTDRVHLDRGDLPGLVARAQGVADRGGRRLLGIVGAPGAGKSTLAAQLVAALGPVAVLLPMDGFHLAQQVLEDLGRTERKGAVDTFDAGGFVHLLGRVRAASEDVVYAPTFRRDLEEPVAGAVAIRRETPLVVVEGNYLLADEPGWRGVRGLLDESWFVDPGEDQRREWLIARHMAFGRDHTAAVERSDGSDQANAVLIEGCRDHADVIVGGR